MRRGRVGELFLVLGPTLLQAQLWALQVSNSAMRAARTRVLPSVPAQRKNKSQSAAAEWSQTAPRRRRSGSDRRTDSWFRQPPPTHRFPLPRSNARHYALLRLQCLRLSVITLNFRGEGEPASTTWQAKVHVGAGWGRPQRSSLVPHEGSCLFEDASLSPKSPSQAASG